VTMCTRAFYEPQTIGFGRMFFQASARATGGPARRRSKRVGSWNWRPGCASWECGICWEGAANTRAEWQSWLLRGLRYLRHAGSCHGCVCIAGEPLGSVDLASRGDRGWKQLDTCRVPSASLRASSNAADSRSPPCPPCDTTFLCQHADVGKSINSGRSIPCPNLAPVFAQCRARSNQRAYHRLALVRDCASCHPLSPAAATRNRSQGSVASTSSSSFSL